MGLSLPHDATSTLYIEGLPADASEREVAHIFRRYDGHGFQSVRMRAIESSKSPGTNLFLCYCIAKAHRNKELEQTVRQLLSTFISKMHETQSEPGIGTDFRLEMRSKAEQLPTCKSSNLLF